MICVDSGELLSAEPNTPSVFLIAAFVLERFLLRKQPKRRPVISWLVTGMMVASTINRAWLLSVWSCGPLRNVLRDQTVEAIHILMWAAAFAALDYIVMQSWLIWRRDSMGA